MAKAMERNRLGFQYKVTPDDETEMLTIGFFYRTIVELNATVTHFKHSLTSELKECLGFISLDLPLTKSKECF